MPGMYLLIKSPSTAVRNGNESTIPYEEVNINCAEVNATGFQDGGIYKFISGPGFFYLPGFLFYLFSVKIISEFQAHFFNLFDEDNSPI